MKSKTKINKQTQRKTNQELVETIRGAKKNKEWLEVAGILASTKKNKVEVNLSDLENKKGLVVVPGKVLSMGEVKGKFKIAALGFSEKAKEKLQTAGCETLTIMEAIKLKEKGFELVK